MKRASIGDLRLANQVNAVADNPYFIHRSTLRNWRTGAAQKVNNWRQLVTVAVALGLDEIEANALLESGGCPPLQALSVTAREADAALLAYWRVEPGKPAGSCSRAEDQADRSLPSPGSSDERNRPALPDAGKRGFGKAGLVSLVGLGMLVAVLAPASFRILSSGASTPPANLLVNSGFDQGGLGWTTYVNDEATADFDVVDGAIRVRIAQTATEGWHIALNQKDLEVTAGETYTVRFRARGDRGTSVKVDLTRVVDPKTTLSFGNSGRKKVSVSRRWTTSTIAFEATETMTLKDGGARLFFRFGSSNAGLVMLDDIELFEGSDLPMR